MLKDIRVKFGDLSGWIGFSVVALIMSGAVIYQQCGPAPSPPPPPEDTSHPHPPTDTEMCEDACQRMEALGCEEAKPLEDGTTCLEFCVYTQNAGHGLNPSCIAGINSCEGIKACTEHP